MKAHAERESESRSRTTERVTLWTHARTPALSSLAFAIGASLAGCNGEVASPAPDVTREQVLEAVTPEVAQSVGPDGKFQLEPRPNTGRAQISDTYAGDLAVALAKHNLPYLNEYFDGQRGKRISYQKLSACGQPIYAESPFQRLEIDDVSMDAHPLQKALGPFWLVTLCVASEPQMKIAVSAYSTSLYIGSNGEIVFPAVGGNDFIAEGVPIDESTDALPSAEAAVVLVANMTGRRITSIPRLIVPYYEDDSPLGARWQLRLDGVAHLRTPDNQKLEATELYVSRIRETHRPGSRTWKADPIQPDAVEVTFIPLAHVGENMTAYQARKAAETRTLPAHLLSEAAINFTAAGSDR
jgi:hypothetical protein